MFRVARPTIKNEKSLIIMFIRFSFLSPISSNVALVQGSQSEGEVDLHPKVRKEDTHINLHINLPMF
jgi:hypothetical protein